MSPRDKKQKSDDDRLNPGQQHEDRLVGGYGGQRKSKSASGAEASRLKQKEQSVGSGVDGGGTAKNQEEQPWELDGVSKKGPVEQVKSAYSNYKKLGIAAAVLGTVVLTSISLFMGLLNLAVVSIKENYYEWSHKRGYTRTAQRASANFEKRYFGDTSGCRTKLCERRYGNGVRHDQVKKLRQSGAERVVYRDKDGNRFVSSADGIQDDILSSDTKKRYFIESATLRDRSGNLIEVNNGNFKEQFNNHKGVRSLLANATDVSGTFPRTTAMVTKLARLGVSRQNPVKDSDGKDRKSFLRALGRAIYGEPPGSRAPDVTSSIDEELPDGIKEDAEALRQDTLEDPTRNPPDTPTVREAARRASDPTDPDNVKRFGRFGRATGVLEGSCIAREALRGLVFAVKYYRMLALVKYAGTFMAFGDAVKANKITPAQVGFMSDLLLKPDSEGRTFFDSPGYQHLAYGVSPNRESIDAYTTGRSSAGFLAGAYGAVRTLDKITPANSTEGVCDYALSAEGQLSFIVVDIATFATGIGGIARIILGAAAGYGIGVLVGSLLEYVAPQIVRAVSGTVGTGNESGYEIGTMLAAGVSNTSSNMSRSQGLRPMTKEEVAASETEVNQLYADLFDDQKPSLTRKVATNMAVFSVSTVADVKNIFMPQKLFATTRANHSVSGVYAVNQVEGNNKTCEDPELEKFATTPYCSLIYGENTETLMNNPKYDPAAVVNWMVENEYISEEEELSNTEAQEDAEEAEASCEGGSGIPPNGWDLVDENKNLHYEFKGTRFEKEFKEAANAWNEYGCVNIEESPSSSETDVVVLDGDTGSSAGLAHPPDKGSKIVLTSGETTAPLAVAKHEIGHVLGFPHAQQGSIMIPTVNKDSDLTDYDCSVYQEVWGGNEDCKNNNSSSEGGEGTEKAPKQNEYENYVEVCMDGIAPLMDAELSGVDTMGNGTTLEYCSSTKEKFTYFRMYRLDSNIVEPPEALNDEFYETPLQVEGEGSSDSGPTPSGELAWPVGGDKGSIGNCYGYNPNYINFGGYHYGLDIFAAQGTPVYAGADGTVTESLSESGVASRGPNYVAVHHPDMNMSTGYLHMASRTVEVGDKVKQGDQIGTVGTNQGTHLHFNTMPGDIKNVGPPKGHPDFKNTSLNPEEFLTKPSEVNYIYNAKKEGGCDGLKNG